MPGYIQQKLNHQYDFECACSFKSLQILEAAIQLKKDPSRWSLVSNLLHDPILNTAYIPFKVAEIFFHFLSLACVDIDDLKNQEKFLKSYLVRILITDPVDCLVQVICMTTRLASTILGLVKPRYALHGWMLTEKLALINFKFRAHLLGRYINSQEHPKVNRDLIPHSAVRYLGIKDALYLNDRIENRENKARLISHIRQSFEGVIKDIQARDQDYLTHSLKIAKKQKPVGFYAIIRDYNGAQEDETLYIDHHLQKESIPALKKAREWAIKGQTHRFRKDKFALADIKNLSYYIGAHLRSQSQPHLKNAKKFTTTNTKINRLDGLLSQYYKFGQTSFCFPHEEFSLDAYTLIYGR